MKYKKHTRTLTVIQNRLNPVFLNLDGPVPQFQGRNFNQIRGKKWILENQNFHFQISSPQNIITSFQNGYYLEGIALVASWGTMWRTARFIYTRDLIIMEQYLSDAYNSISGTSTIDKPWLILENNLNWSPVMISKTLNFMYRAKGIEEAAPVAIDNAVVLNKIWPEFKNYYNFPVDNWRGGLDGYKRYMTFINGLR
jgi:hypothetical protein